MNRIKNILTEAQREKKVISPPALLFPPSQNFSLKDG